MCLSRQHAQKFCLLPLALIPCKVLIIGTSQKLKPLGSKRFIYLISTKNWQSTCTLQMVWDIPSRRSMSLSLANRLGGSPDQGTQSASLHWPCMNSSIVQLSMYKLDSDSCKLDCKFPIKIPMGKVITLLISTGTQISGTLQKTVPILNL